MKRYLKGLLDDWARAPFSGTALIASNLAGLMALLAGNIDRALLWTIVIVLLVRERHDMLEGR